MEEQNQPVKRGRGRPRKIPVEENKKILNESSSTLHMSQQTSTPSASSDKSNKKVSMRDVQHSLTSLFAEALRTNPLKFNDFINSYNPFLQNNRLKMITSYPMQYAPEQINEFLKQPQYHEQELRSASTALSATQYLYYSILREACDVPLFKTVVVPPQLTQQEYKSDEFLKEEQLVLDWLKKLDVVNTGKRVQLETKRDGKSTYLHRQSLKEHDGQKEVCYVSWQKLPLRWTKLTGIGEHGYIASFNFLIFMQPEFSPEQYPPFIQELWQQLLRDGAVYTKKDKNGATSYACNVNKIRTFSIESSKYPKRKGVFELSESEVKSYMYWVELPQDLCFTFASDTSNAWAVPDTIGLFPALQELTDYSTLAGLIASTPLTAVLTGEAEAVSGAAPGQDQFILSPHNMLAFQNAFNDMASSNIQAFLAPFKNLKLQSLPNIPNASDIKTKATQNFITTAGEAGIITATDKPSVAMIKGNQVLTASRYDFVTKQIQTIINDILNRHLDLQYHWEVKIWGDIFSFTDTVKLLKEQVAAGETFLLPYLASAYDLTIVDVAALNVYVESKDIYSHLKPLNWAISQINGESVTNSTSDSTTPGRPSIDVNEIENDNTAASKEAGTNTGDMRDFVAQNICPMCHSHTEEGHIYCEECENYLGLDSLI